MNKIAVFAVFLLSLTLAAPAVASAAPDTETPAAAAVATINVNEATSQELQSLPRVGEVTAGRIIDYREKHNGFKSVDELQNVKGIGTKTLAKLRDLVSVN